ncbi:MAG: hypothetical protein WA020_06850 [Candidatus Acidiferrales bacterium]
MSDTIRPGAEMSEPIHTSKFPPWVRWASLIWFAVWFPVYWRTWGVQNFLHVCDITVILTCVGFWCNSPLVISSQAVSSILVDFLWNLDAAWRLFTGHHLTGGTEYMWDPHYPLWVRLLSLFHIVWPVLLLWALGHAGYDRRGLALQSAIAAVTMLASRFTNPAMNINYVFRDPIAHRALGPAPVHVALMWIGLVILIYLPTHLALAKLFPAPPAEKIQPPV